MSDERDLPGVSYVMPVLNEADYVASAVRSVLAQDYPGPTEVVLALGPSTDGTDEVVAALAAEDPRLRSVPNPQAHIPVGLNRAIAQCSHPVIVRVDAHTELPAGYTEAAVRTLLETGAASVGGIMLAVGRPGFQAAVARGYNSRLGLGGASYHDKDVAAGPAESAYLGVMRAEVLAEVGGYDESLRRGEDWELNHRIRAAGHLIWLDPALHVSYWPRATWTALRRQFVATGIWRGELVRRLGQRNSLRFFAPPLFVLSLLASLVVLPLVALGALHGVVGLVLAVLAGIGPALYALMLVGVALLSGGSLADRLRYPLVLATMHVAWGGGFLVGVLRGARDAVDTSRHES